MKKLILAIAVIACLTGCSLKGFNVKVDDVALSEVEGVTIDEVKPAEVAK